MTRDCKDKKCAKPAACPTPPSTPLPPPPPIPATELPIYEAPHAQYKESLVEKLNPCNDTSYVRSLLMPTVTAVRSQIQTGVESLSGVTSVVSENYTELRSKSEWMVKYLREEENEQKRIGAVGMGALTGFIFGLRGGIFRRVIYSGVGTGIMSAICFPEETDQFASTALDNGRHYANIAYNFCYGVKPGDPQLEIKFPDLSVPKNFSEFVELSSSLVDTVKQAVSPPPPPTKSKSKDEEECDKDE